MTRLVVLPRAEQDLQEIWLSTAYDNPAAADRIADSITRMIDRLAVHPRLGRRRPDLRPSVRMLVTGHYLILCQTVPDDDGAAAVDVEIVRIVDGRRDLPRLFHVS